MTSDKTSGTILQEAVAYTESIVNTVREPLLVLNHDLHVVTASRSFFEVFAVSPEETIGRFVYDLGKGQWDIPLLRKLLGEVLPQHKAFEDFEVAHDFPSIGKRVMLLNGRKLLRPGNSTEHIVLAIEDVTERKRISDELVRSNEELQSFAYVAAHDLRSPLNSGIALLQLLSRRAENRLPTDDVDLLKTAISNFCRLGTLMEDILEYSTAANAPQQPGVLELIDPLNVALANLRHHIDANGGSISVDTLPSVRAGRSQMVIVFQNLIGNALKYRSDKTPHIGIGAVRAGESWQISVADNGQGFDPTFRAKIFEPFKRLHGNDIPGSGIGLATSKRIIDRLGGRIWANSTPGSGSTFYFTLPSAT